MSFAAAGMQESVPSGIAAVGLQAEHGNRDSRGTHSNEAMAGYAFESLRHHLWWKQYLRQGFAAGSTESVSGNDVPAL